MDSVEIIFFDAGGTLLYPEPGVGEAYASAGLNYGIRADPAEVQAAFGEAFHRRKRDTIHQDREWWRGVVMETLGRFGESTDPDRMFTEIFDHFAAVDTWRLYPGGLETVRELRRRGYRTGMISNWDDRLPSLLEELGLLAGLDPMVTSHRVGVEKPDPLIFQVAVAEAGVAPARALMVGDDRRADVEGAHALGMNAVHIDRQGGADGGGHTIGHLLELLELFPPKISAP